MGLLDIFKNKKQPVKPSEKNMISDRDLTAKLADHGLAQLEKGTDYDDLANTKVEFGYLFLIEGHGLEGLYKIITDKTTAYFAVQGEKLMKLKFNEELYKSTVEGFLDIHG